MDTKHSGLCMYGLHFIQDILTLYVFLLNLPGHHFRMNIKPTKLQICLVQRPVIYIHIYIYIYSNQICQDSIVGWIAFVLQHVTFKTYYLRPSPTNKR